MFKHIAVQNDISNLCLFFYSVLPALWSLWRG